MAFPWPGKKDTPPPDTRPKREFPAEFDLGSPADSGGAKSGAMESASSKPPALPARRQEAPPRDAAALEELTERLCRLGELLDQTKRQVTEYLIDRDSRTATGGDPDISEKLDYLAERLEQIGSGGGGSRSLEQSLDRIFGKLAILADAPSRPSGGGEGAAPGVSEATVKGALRPVAEKLDQVDGKCKTLTEKIAAIDDLKNGFVATLVKVRDGLTEQHTALGNGIRQVHDTIPQYFNAIPQYFAALQQQIAAGMQEIINILRPPQAEPASGPAVSGDWQQAILGSELASIPALEHQRQQLFRGLLTGEPAACSMAGQLLVFRSAPVERMPALLKDIGEAYYRWQPRNNNRPTEMERALVGWLQRTCAEAGIPNTIELVNPGERFDASRHNANERGVEITHVLGWIVLRDNGKVYTKASVAVK